MGAAGIMGQVAALGFQLRGDEAEARAKDKESVENTGMAIEAATDAHNRGAEEAGRQRVQGAQLVARQKVAYANSGVDSSVGTAAAVQSSTQQLSEVDAKTIENNATREAWGYRKHGLKFQQQAELDRVRRGNERGGKILTTLGGLASQYKPDQG